LAGWPSSIYGLLFVDLVLVKLPAFTRIARSLVLPPFRPFAVLPPFRPFALSFFRYDSL
jgi:hypothetical protein